MNYFKCFVAVVVLFVLSSGCLLAGSMTAPAGYTWVDTPITLPMFSYLGGFDVLPNGNFVILDGYSVREIDRSGVDVRTIFTYSESVYGSFVKYNPANDKIYFGESKYGTIRSIAASGGTAGIIANVPFNFDIAFYGGNTFVVGGTVTYLVDETNGSLDPIFDSYSEENPIQASGPLAFDADGNMYYGSGEGGWGVRYGQDIYKFSASEVASAIGGLTLVPDAAHRIAENIDGPYGFAIDGSGGLFYTTMMANPGELRLLKNGNDTLFSAAISMDKDPSYIHYNQATGELCVVVIWFDEYWNQTAVVSTLQAVPEPSSVAALFTFIGLTSTKLLRCRRK